MSNILRDYLEEAPQYPVAAPVEEEKKDVLQSYIDEEPAKISPTVVVSNTEPTNKPDKTTPLTVLDMFAMYAPAGENDPQAYADSAVSYINNKYQLSRFF